MHKAVPWSRKQTHGGPEETGLIKKFSSQGKCGKLNFMAARLIPSFEHVFISCGTSIEPDVMGTIFGKDH